MDVLLEALPQVFAGGSKAQVVVLGTGKKALEQSVAQIESKFPSNAKGVVEFNGEPIETGCVLQYVLQPESSHTRVSDDVILPEPCDACTSVHRRVGYISSVVGTLRM